MSSNKFQVKDWDDNFENNKSREREECSFVCLPNKQDGIVFARIMAQEDGAAIYGIFAMILAACSQQGKPRNGWLTFDGSPDGEPWTAEDLSIKFRRPIREIERALNFLASEKIGWLKSAQPPQLELFKESSARAVPAQCPPSASERKKEEKERREEKRIEEKELSSVSAEKIYEAFPLKVGKPAALKAITKKLAQHDGEFLLNKTKLFAEIRAGNLDYVPHPSTWFNQDRFLDDAETWKPKGKKTTGSDHGQRKETIKGKRV